MAKLQVFICDVCGKEHREECYGNGAPGWGAFQGIVLNGVDSPVLCIEHKTKLAEHLDTMVEEYRK